jgi:hypothetical protein
MAFVDPGTQHLRWNNAEHGSYKGRFDDIKRQCENGNLIAFVPKAGKKTVNTTHKPLDLFWVFSPEFLRWYCQRKLG